MRILNLHSHSEFSNFSCGFKDTTNKLKDLLDYAFNNGHAGIGLTDHESVTGHIQAFDWYENKLKQAETDEEVQRVKDFKLILGNEVYIGREGLNSENHKTGEKFHHFLLLALDEVGQKQLRRLSSLAWERGYMKNVMRRFNYISDFKEVIGEEKGHIVATTACIANLAGHLLETYPESDAAGMIDEYIKTLVDTFGDGNLFIELSPALYPEQIKYNKFMVKRYSQMLPFVITNDVHYLEKSDYETFKVFMKGARRDDVDSYYKYSHFMSEDEIRKNMNYLDSSFIDTALQNALDIGERSSIYNLNHKVEIPEVPFKKVDFSDSLNDFADNFEYIKMFKNSKYEQDRNLFAATMGGIDREEKLASTERLTSVFSRINMEWEELWGISETIESRVSSYLLTMMWLVNSMWDAGTIVGPGRGSAVAFSTNYYLGITDVNPIDYPLEIPHWRFLSSTRPELPDIDIDSPSADRSMLLSYLKDKFEEIGGQVVQVATYGRETSKKALRSIARGLEIPDETIDYIAALIPSERGVQLSLSQCYYGDEDHKPIKEFVDQMDEYPELWEHSSKIEGLITQMGVHAGGVIFSNKKIYENNSLVKTKQGVLITAYDLHESEGTGLIKYD